MRIASGKCSRVKSYFVKKDSTYWQFDHNADFILSLLDLILYSISKSLIIFLLHFLLEKTFL